MHIIDSHTGGEPTRVIVSGGPALGPGSLSRLRECLRTRFDWVRRSVVCEPRGTEGLVGALLCAPADPACVAGIVYFNRAGYLGMCGHATMGLAVTLQRIGLIGPGRHLLETPVGVVSFELADGNAVTVENVPSRRFRKGVTVEVPGFAPVTGDVAWGGNWFFLSNDAPCPLTLEFVDELTTFAKAVRTGLAQSGVTGGDGAEIDHIELCGRAEASDADGRNFVLCPDGAYDRSPCGTGTSAKLACLAADGLLAAGKSWTQESITGSRFEASYEEGPDGSIVPRITGTAFVTSVSRLVLEESDPLAYGMGPIAGQGCPAPPESLKRVRSGPPGLSARPASPGPSF
ncbi:MAG: proline racemase family protein [Pseudomonadota bacterium]